MKFRGRILTVVGINSIAALLGRKINTSLHDVDNEVGSDINPFLI